MSLKTNPSGQHLNPGQRLAAIARILENVPVEEAVATLGQALVFYVSELTDDPHGVLEQIRGVIEFHTLQLTSGRKRRLRVVANPRKQAKTQ
jgi:hypothetical protein